MGDRYLITGGGGFVGSHLTEALLTNGHQVTVLDTLSTGQLPNLARAREHERFRFVQGSVFDEHLVDNLVHGCDFVVHLAAAVGVRLIVEHPLRSLTTNIRGSEIVLEAAVHYDRKILITSTSEIYGKNQDVPLSETSDCVLGSPAVPRWAYSTAKAVVEILAFTYHYERGLPATVVRLFNTVGPRQSHAYGMVIPRMVRQALAGEPLTVYGDGTQTRCFSHVTDVVGGLIALLDHPGAIGEMFNIGTEHEISILDLAHRIRTLTASASEIRLIPFSEAYTEGFEDIPRRVPDTTKIRSLTGWKPERELDDVLNDTIAEARGSLAQPANAT